MYSSTNDNHEIVSLRREVAQLRKGYNALRDKRDDLLAENRRLRKELDATEAVVTLLSIMVIMAIGEED